MITGKTTDSSLWIVEFYDIRAAAETFNNLHGYSFDVWFLSFFFFSFKKINQKSKSKIQYSIESKSQSYFLKWI